MKTKTSDVVDEVKYWVGLECLQWTNGLPNAVKSIEVRIESIRSDGTVVVSNKQWGAE